MSSIFSFANFESVIGESLDIKAMLICTLASLVLGLIVAVVYTIKSTYTKSFFMTLALLPMVVQAVIMMVNNKLGVALAVAGTFGLVRFRSAPGSAKDICLVFLVMAIGLATGLGFVSFAIIITLFTCVVFLLLKLLPVAGEKNSKEKILRITIPEDLDYAKEINSILNKYCTKVTLERTKTTNLGSLFELKYHLIMSVGASEKSMIDDIRAVNSNLPISLSVFKEEGTEL